MQRFRFRLGGLLRLRSQLERAGRRSLAEAMGTVAGVEQRLGAATQGMQDCERMGCSNEPHAPLARALAKGLARHRLHLTNQLRAAQAQLDRARGDWLERRRDERALASLQDRRRDEWRREQDRAEQLEMEELARFGARAAEEDRT
ncbi:MAG: flagellar FliJ family protein [Planctomycetota bacterium]